MISSTSLGLPLLDALDQVVDLLAGQQLVAVLLDDLGDVRRDHAVGSTTV
jgi:hypothetical protein